MVGDLLFFLSFLFSFSSIIEGDLLPPGVTSVTDWALAPSAGGTAVCQRSCPGSHCTTEGDFLPTSIIEGDLPLRGLRPVGFRPLLLFPLPPRLQMPLGVFVTGAVVGGDPAVGIFAGGDLDGVLE